MTDEHGRRNRRGTRSLVALLASVPKLIVALLGAELQHLKSEMTGKLASLGIGVGMFLGVAVLGWFLFAVLLAAAILGLSVVFPGWLSALIVAGALIVVMIVLALIGVAKVKKAIPLAPTETIESIREDIRAIKGMGIYDEH